MMPSCVGAMQHSRVLMGSVISKCVPAISASAVSESFCIHACSSSGECSCLSGSAFRAAMASCTVAPGLICSATARCSASSSSSFCTAQS